MEKERREHVLILPFMAQGHIIPFLALALDIERRKKYKITFINTPLNISKLRSSLPPNSNIRLRSIPFDSVRHGLPPNTESTDALPYDLIFRLMESSFALEPDLRRLVGEIVREEESEGCHPLCIITDMFFAWAGRVAHEFGVFHAIFAATSGFGMACYHSLWSTAPKWKVGGAEEFEMEDFPEGGKVHITGMPASMAAADGDDPWSVFQRKMLAEWYDADAALFNDVEELDRVGLGYFRRKIGLPVWAIGPILKQDRQENDGVCRAWLDSKPPRSVVYVCFGSQNTLTSSQMVEMALALDASGRFFIWVVRPPLGKELEAGLNAEDWLPPGFVERVQGRGLIVRKWAPQVEILSHGSTGSFISHCGWNSALEAISYGVPIISWPMAGEQFFNVKLLEGELGICVELARGNGCKVSYQDITRKIDMVMGENQGAKELRKRASKVKKIISDAKRDEVDQRGSSVRALDEFFTATITRRGEEEKKQNNSTIDVLDCSDVICS